MTLTVVLDINGVLADVRKKYEKTPVRRPCDLIIPSGQKVYIRPGIERLFNFLNNMNESVKVVVWTSRKRVNADPILMRLAAAEYDLRPMLYLSGEDCPSCYDYHPVKEAHIVRQRLRLDPSSRIVFLDDNPDYLRLDSCSTVLPVKTYKAEETLDGEDVPLRVACSLYSMIKTLK